MADVFGLQALRSLTEAVADRRKASSIMNGDAFGLEKTVIEKDRKHFRGLQNFLKNYARTEMTPLHLTLTHENY